MKLAISRFSILWRRAARLVLRRSYAPALIALIVVIIAGIFADYQNRQVFAQRLRNDVLNQVSLVRAKLEGNITGNIQLVRGLVATIATEPGMDQERFARLSEKLLREGPELTHLAAAPGLVVSLIYPMKGNEGALGLDYRRRPAQRAAALRARDTGMLVLAGPIDLVQGGRAFVARFPVFTGGPGEKRRFWGIVSAVLDIDRLYHDSGLLDRGLPIDIAITGKDGQGASGEPFFGEETVLAHDPVDTFVSLPSGSWRIAAVPKGGWDKTPPNAWFLHLLIVIAGAFIVVPMIVTGRLVEERQKNIRELQRRSRQLARLSHRLGLALETSKVAVWEFNLETGALLWDNRMNELYGHPADGGERRYADWKGRLHPDDVTRAEADFWQCRDITGRYESDYRICLADGRIRHIRAIGGVFDEIDGGRRIIGVNWDVTADVNLTEDLTRANALTEARNIELERAKARIEHTSLHDALTGLPNRRYLDEILENRARLTHGPTARIALLHIDLDRFKQINDTLGHAAGDAMLVHVAEVLKANLGPGDFVARIGGDEFVVLCETGADRNDAAAQAADLATRVILEMRRPVPYETHECRFGVSVGIAIEPEANSDLRRLLVNADIALYRAKSRGRNRYQFFTDRLEAEIVATKQIADEILNGLENNQFIAHYQPQFDAQTHDIVGVEALVRWNHPTRGLLRPIAFLEIAEELNVVPEIDRIVLEQAIADLEQWNRLGLDVPRVSVNVSARRLRDEELIKSLGRLDFAPGSLSFELVESIFLDENDELITWNVDRIKELGIDIEIDDFGTGYASIVSLQKLKPKRLKIDRQLVMPVARSSSQRQLVHSIIDIGRSLGIEVIAEGVETMGHARVMASMGCHGLQGYAFARPMSAQAFADFVRASAWRKAS